MNFPDKYVKFCQSVTLGTGETTHTIVAGVAGVQIVITRAIMTCLVSAAQAVYIGDSSGTNKGISVAASFPVNTQAQFNSQFQGLALNVGEDLVIKPAAAGPSFHCVVEGYHVL